MSVRGGEHGIVCSRGAGSDEEDGMNTLRVIRAIGTVLAACLSAGCASAPVPDVSARWVPSAAAKFVTLGRSASYALVHREGQDLLIAEDPIVAGDGGTMTGRLTWIAGVPPVAKLESPIEVRDAWLIEQIPDGQAHATPAHGTVVIHQRSADAILATLHLQAPTAPPTAGQVVQRTIDLDRRIEFARHEPLLPQYREMGPRQGVAKK